MSTNTKIALVTGGSRGLGREMALNIAKKGLNVIITYNSRKDAADAVISEIEQLGQKAAALRLNTGLIALFDDFFSRVQDLLEDKFAAEKFDYLINNAGIALQSPFAETTEEAFDELINIHYKGVYFLTQKALPFLNDNGGIVNISTGLTRFSYPGVSVYASAKAAVEVATRYMAKELGNRGINVNVVAPGPVVTDFGGGGMEDNEQMQEYMKSITAIPRIAYPKDIGPVVAFLCTDEAKWINAQRIEVSGGMNL
ncbi:SDR family oxidoreductase [Olivibacter sitiensis]|uniref:SDR family oxidoreductase n=1 Tax=Olivibacter sitiensis TaxID=376470 RepID=UPI0004869B23|nr:SDR family oxidoreductase [Olivibacter sitiensis]